MSGPIRNFEATMCSVDIVDVINEERKAEAAGADFSTLRHDHFMVKIEKHPGIDSPKFLGQYKDSTGRSLKCYNLPKREAELMVMSESLKVQTRVYDRLAAIEAGALPAPNAPPPASRQVDEATRALKMVPLAMRAAKAFGLDQNAAAISVNQYVRTMTGQNLLESFGSTHLQAENQETQWFTPSELSAQAKMPAKDLNLLLASAGFQKKRGKKWELIDAGRPFARIFDVGKQQGTGVPIQQLKWSPAVIDAARKASKPTEPPPGSQQQLGLDPS